MVRCRGADSRGSEPGCSLSGRARFYSESWDGETGEDSGLTCVVPRLCGRLLFTLLLSFVPSGLCAVERLFLSFGISEMEVCMLYALYSGKLLGFFEPSFPCI